MCRVEILDIYCVAESLQDMTHPFYFYTHLVILLTLVFGWKVSQ
jgi:hypothetical protein